MMTDQMIKDVNEVSIYRAKYVDGWTATIEAIDGKIIKCLNGDTLPELIDLVASEMGMNKTNKESYYPSLNSACLEQYSVGTKRRIPEDICGLCAGNHPPGCCDQ